MTVTLSTFKISIAGISRAAVRLLLASLCCFLLGSGLLFARADGLTSTAKVACPSFQFSEFLKRFSDDVQTQRQFTRDPLVYYEYVDADPEPVMSKRLLYQQKRGFPILPSTTQRQQQKLQLNILKQSATAVTVQLSKPDTDYQIDYLFEKKDCWMLVQEKNHSF